MIHLTKENSKMYLFFELHFKRFDILTVPHALQILQSTGQNKQIAEKSLQKLIEHGFFEKNGDWLKSEFYAPCKNFD